MWESVELREIRVSIALAEELHFGRTADRLGLTQSRVSQTIRTLEAKLGARLFNRTSRRVTLTPFGQRLLEQVRVPHDQLARVLRETAIAERALTGNLRLELLSAPCGGPHLVDIISAFESRCPGAHVRVSDVDWADPLGRLRRGEVDLQAIRLPLDRPDIEIGPILSREHRVVAVAKGHPLAERESISLEEVADHCVARIDTYLDEVIEAHLPRFSPSGRPIRRLDEPTQSFAELFTLVARGTIVHPTVPSLAEFVSHPNVTLIPLTGMPPSETALVWMRDSTDPRVEAFVAVAREVLPPDLGGG
jgi:DNA-binding transcriptional LysR family regulator